MSKNTIAEENIIITTKQKTLFDSLVKLLKFKFLRGAKPTVAVLRLGGVIGKTGGVRGTGLTIEGLNDNIERAFNLPKLKAVCLVINSPGGSPVQAELIAKRIIGLSQEKKVPVFSFVEDVAASGGYWLACAGKEIYASKSSIVGSIGVISSGFGLTEAIDKVGIERRVITAGKNKSVLDPFMPVKDEDIELIRKIQKQIHGHFIDYVKTQRSGKLTQIDDILFNGEFWAGETAEDFGLIDGIDDIYSFVKRKFGEKINIQYVTSKQSWFKRNFSIDTVSLSGSISAELKHSLKEFLTSNKYDLM